MKKTNLLASVALFSELYNSDTYKSIPDIIAEFIKGAILLENKYNFNSTELKDLMYKVYGFNIPESVLKTVLLNKFKDSVKLENRIFYIQRDNVNLGHENISANVESISIEQNKIIIELHKYIETKTSAKLSSEEKDKVFSTFSHILMENGYSDKYSDLISAFIIVNEKDRNFIDNLNNIKEGLILYQGINFTSDINQLGNWNTDLTLYLSTEHLFNCEGYNGLLMKEIFDDLFKLIIEINASNKKKHRKLIELRYLEETKNEIDYFFRSAESIFRGFKTLDPSKEAMRTILKNVDSVSDIEKKRILFYSNLNRIGIEYQSINFDIDNAEFNVVDQNLLEELKKESVEKNRFFDEEYCINVLKIFTKINTFRHGNNKFPIENVRHLYITENGYAKYLAHNEKVKFENYDVAFAKDIDFIISKFWFKLKKGFSNKSELPKSFDVVTKAKIIISSHLKSSLSKSFEKLTDEYNQGKLTEQQAMDLNSSFKEKSDSPEDISFENIETSLNFLNDNDVLGTFLQERTKRDALFEQTLSEKNALEDALKLLKEEEGKKAGKKKLKDLDKAKTAFSKIEWKQYTNLKKNELLYCFKIVVLTILPIIVGLLLKVIEPLNLWIISIGNYEYIIWSVLIVIFLCELFGRAYIFNKEKIKNGWEWGLIKLSRTKYKAHKYQKMNEFSGQYIEKPKL